MNTAYPQIPYGWADFEGMRRERTLYVEPHLQRYAGMRHGYVMELAGHPGLPSIAMGLTPGNASWR